MTVKLNEQFYRKLNFIRGYIVLFLCLLKLVLSNTLQKQRVNIYSLQVVNKHNMSKVNCEQKVKYKKICFKNMKIINCRLG